MSVNSIEEIIEDFKAGKMIILTDDESRENEGDIFCHFFSKNLRNFKTGRNARGSL